MYENKTLQLPKSVVVNVLFSYITRNPSSDCCLSAKLEIHRIEGCHVVSVEDAYGRNLGFLDRISRAHTRFMFTLRNARNCAVLDWVASKGKMFHRTCLKKL
jgi:hypothetical protein